MVDRSVDKEVYIGSDGGIEVYNDPYKGITPEDAQVAIQLEQRIIAEKQTIEKSFLTLCFLLDEFENRQQYLALGYPSFKTWAESPDVEIGTRVAYDLLRIAREAVPVLLDAYNVEHGEDGPYSDEAMTHVIEQLADARVSKIRSMLPLLNNDQVDDFVGLIERAPEMTWKDINKEVKSLTHGEDAEDEPKPAVFRALVTKGDINTKYEITCTDGLEAVRCGTLTIPTRYADRWNSRFGSYWLEFVEAP